MRKNKKEIVLHQDKIIPIIIPIITPIMDPPPYSHFDYDVYTIATTATTVSGAKKILSENLHHVPGPVSESESESIEIKENYQYQIKINIRVIF